MLFANSDVAATQHRPYYYIIEGSFLLELLRGAADLEDKARKHFLSCVLRYLSRVLVPY
jgi:hypothetical protein